MATHLLARHGSRMDSAMSDLPAQPVQEEEAAMSFEMKLTDREVESGRLSRIFLIIRRVAGMMLGDDLGICYLVSFDNHLPTRALARRMQPIKYLYTKYLSTNRFKFRDMDENFYPLGAYPHLQRKSFILKSVVITCTLYKHIPGYLAGWELLNYVT